MKTAIVTGATRGIGKAITQKLLDEGYFVIGTFVNSISEAEEFGKYKNIDFIKADSEKEKDIQQVFSHLKEKFGILDLLVNNAGVNLTGMIETYTTSDWDKISNIDLRAVFLFSKFAIPFLRKSDDGVIINISSRIGEREVIGVETIPYGVMKAGVSAFTVGLSRELGGKIRVNAVLPAPTKTDLFDKVFTKEEEEEFKRKGKLGQPVEVAELVWNLVKDKNANGRVLSDPRISG